MFRPLDLSDPTVHNLIFLLGMGCFSGTMLIAFITIYSVRGIQTFRGLVGILIQSAIIGVIGFWLYIGLIITINSSLTR